MITARAQAVKTFGQKFFLRWGHEMNGNWYPWDGANNGANLAATTTFISAYRHIHDLFVAAGATNALWVFCPNVDSVPGDSWNQWQNYYPGDAYVDWMGFDGYNWGTVQTTSTWQTFPDDRESHLPEPGDQGEADHDPRDGQHRAGRRQGGVDRRHPARR